jgi:hypothetical protein
MGVPENQTATKDDVLPPKPGHPFELHAAATLHHGHDQRADRIPGLDVHGINSDAIQDPVQNQKSEVCLSPTANAAKSPSAGMGSFPCKRLTGRCHCLDPTSSFPAMRNQSQTGKRNQTKKQSKNCSEIQALIRYPKKLNF